MIPLTADSLIEIFSTLSIQELLSLRLICKKWQSLIERFLASRKLPVEDLLDLALNCKIREISLYFRYLQVSESTLQEVISTLILNYWTSCLFTFQDDIAWVFIHDNSPPIKEGEKPLDIKFFQLHQELLNIVKEQILLYQNGPGVKFKISFQGLVYILDADLQEKIAKDEIRLTRTSRDYLEVITMLSEKREELNPKLETRFSNGSLKILFLYNSYFYLHRIHRGNLQNPSSSEEISYFEKARIFLGKSLQRKVSFYQGEKLSSLKLEEPSLYTEFFELERTL